ncbi:MAG: tRNA dihydrouridine(20/20a) synthase DusA [Burkholderiales bacterium]|jgi:tRNA-dihydrouridine synthase A|nr:tRNA dihydrouridine(20/20a) synthase DusA [Burkholderiales bacterium]
MTTIAIAPMLDWTDRHYRYFMRQITKHTELYTEMIVADAILHGNLDRLLGFDKIELPLILQLGGSDPEKLATAGRIAVKYGYSGINLNVGCPSDRVKSGNFGACLMQDGDLVATCIKTIQDAVDIPVSIKHRTGLNYNYDYEYLRAFVGTVATTGCNHFIIHARNAILSGLSPKQNREIPPLRYDFVYQLKQEFPHLNIVINGGIKTVSEIHEHLEHVDGVMLGREAYYNPYLFAGFDGIFFGDNEQGNDDIASREEIAHNMIPYLEQCAKNNIYLHHITRHMIGLYHGCPKAKIWRYTLTNEMIKTNNISTYTDLLSKFAE